MNTLRNKNSLFIVPFLLMLTAPTTSCMELDQSKKQIKRTRIINGTISMFPLEGAVTYASQEFHKLACTDKRFKSSSADPVMVTLIIISQDLSPHSCLVPAKYLYNLNDGSTTEFTKAALWNDHDFDEYQFNLVCTKNETLPGKNFMEQYSNTMNKFYVEPVSVTAESAVELTRDGLITDAVVKPTLIPATNQISMTTAFAKHGAKGCSSEQVFVKTMTQEKTRPYDDSMYSLAMRRQTNPKKISHKTMNLIEAQQHLAYHIFLEKNHKAVFALSNKNPVAQACQTTQKKPKKCFLDLNIIPERAELELYSQRQLAPDSLHDAE